MVGLSWKIPARNGWWLGYPHFGKLPNLPGSKKQVYETGILQSYAKAPQLGQGSGPDWRNSCQPRSSPMGALFGLFMGITMVIAPLSWEPATVAVSSLTSYCSNSLPANDWSRYVDIPRPEICWFPIHRATPSHPFIAGVFHEINHPAIAIGVPPFPRFPRWGFPKMEVPKMDGL